MTYFVRLGRILHQHVLLIHSMLLGASVISVYNHVTIIVDVKIVVILVE